jgi:hypothetical protein
MAYGTGGIVEYTDYNTIQQLVVAILGQYSTGYGQSPQTVTVNGGTGQVSYGTSNIANNRIRYAQWNALQADITALNYHLLGTAPVYNSSALTTATSTTQIRDADRAAYLAVATALTNSGPTTIGGVSYPGCYAKANSGQATLVGVDTRTKTTGIGYGTTAVHTVTMTFGSYQNAQYFFNAGSNVQFTASLTNIPSDGSTVLDNQWSSLLSAMGTITFSVNGTTNSGSGTPATTTGFNQLPTNNAQQLIFEKDVSGATYASDKYVIYASVNTSGVLTFSIQFQNNYTSTGTPGYALTFNVEGTLTSTVQSYYASGSYVSETAYYPTISGSLSGGTYVPTLNSITISNIGSNSWIAPGTLNPATVNVLVIGGGGAGANALFNSAGSGGSAGGVIQQSGVTLTPGSTYTVVIGKGGAGNGNGVASSAFGYTANGGAGGTTGGTAGGGGNGAGGAGGGGSGGSGGGGGAGTYATLLSAYVAGGGGGGSVGGGNGGSSIGGKGASGATPATAATYYGSGGGGGYVQPNVTNGLGGAGYQGVVVIQGYW